VTKERVGLFIPAEGGASLYLSFALDIDPSVVNLPFLPPLPPSLPPSPSSQVDDIVRSIEGQMKELSGLHRKRLLVSFDDSAEVTKEREIQALTDAITDQFRGAERQLTAVGKQEGNESDSEVWREGGREGGRKGGKAGDITDQF